MWCRGPRMRRRSRSLHILPVLPLEEVREQEEHEQESEDAEAEVATLELHRLGDVVEEIDRVAYERVEFLRRQLARLRERESTIRLVNDVVLGIALTVVLDLLESLQLPQ